jgi:hypothetical protein
MSFRCRPLPDPDGLLRDYVDFITASRLCRRALVNPEPPSFVNLLHDFLDHIYRLQQSCHLPEFTDHGLSHLCSLVHRVSEWSTATLGDHPDFLVERLTPDEAAILLLAILFHDIGMLSQRPEDLPIEERTGGVARIDDVATWVRRTHVTRMRGLVSRLLSNTEHTTLLTCPTFSRAFAVAAAHQRWPENWSEVSGRDRGLAALVAVADLLDEDSLRCDTSVLVAHRHGNALNYAHWLRHSLTVSRVSVTDGIIRVRFGRFAHTDDTMAPVYAALRNHFRLAILYSAELATIDAAVGASHFEPGPGIRETTTIVGEDWLSIRGFNTQAALVFHLLRSFLPEALLDDRTLSSDRIRQLQGLGFEPVDMTTFRELPGNIESRSEDEQVFRALLLTRVTT